MAEPAEVEGIIRDYKNNYTPTNCIANKRNGLVPRDIHSPQTVSRRNRKFEQAVTSEEIETAIKDVPRKKSPGPNNFIGKFYKIVEV